MELSAEVFEIDAFDNEDDRDQDVLDLLEEEEGSANPALDSENLFGRLSEEFVRRWRQRRREIAEKKKRRRQSKGLWKKVRTFFRL